MPPSPFDPTTRKFRDGTFRNKAKKGERGHEDRSKGSFPIGSPGRNCHAAPERRTFCRRIRRRLGPSEKTKCIFKSSSFDFSIKKKGMMKNQAVGGWIEGNGKGKCVPLPRTVRARRVTDRGWVAEPPISRPFCRGGTEIEPRARRPDADDGTFVI